MTFQNSRRRIYSAPVLAQVAQMQQVLEMDGIECRIQGEYRGGAAGEIPPVETWPELWVLDPSRVEEARRVVDEALRPAAPEQADWTCPHCRETNEGQFGACWNCGTSMPADPGG